MPRKDAATDASGDAPRRDPVAAAAVEAAHALVAALRAEMRRRGADDPFDVEPEQHDYDLIIPVYNGHDVVIACLDSLLAHTGHRHRILLVDDASPDPRIRPLLERYASRWPHVTYRRLEHNLGFPGAVNTGLAMSDRDVVLVNSDTEFTPQWLARMDRCRRSHPAIHAVSPLSNNATICSVPGFNEHNRLPDGLSIAEMGRLVARTSLRRYPRVPTVVGFCMLMTRAALDTVGPLDMVFGRGYGEEVDWCQRAWARGLESVICDDAYVYHHGEVGFSEVPEKRTLQEQGQRLVTRRWPVYDRAVRTYCLLNPLRAHQQRIATALRDSSGEDGRLRVLQVVHSFNQFAGTELHTRWIADHTRDVADHTVLYPADLTPYHDAVTETEANGTIVCRMNRQLLGTERSIRGIAMNLRSRLAERFFADFLAGSEPDVVHFQHLINFGSLLLPSIAKAFGARVVLTLHDYFVLCPDMNMIQGGTDCGRNRCVPDGACAACLASKMREARPSPEFSMPAWIEERASLVRAALDAADAIVAPSRFVRDRFGDAWGEDVAARIRVIPHGTRPLAIRETRKPGRKLTVAFLGNMSPEKGRDVFLDVVRRMKSDPVRFKVLGNHRQTPDLAGLDNVTFTGQYKPEQIGDLLQQVDVALVLSTWHETYCYTLDEAFRAGVPVIASRVGAIAERVDDGRTGLLVEPNDPAAVMALIRRLVSEPALLDGLRRNVAALSFKSLEQNMADYAALYRELTDQPFDKSAVVRDLMRLNATRPAPPQLTLDEALAGTR